MEQLHTKIDSLEMKCIEKGSEKEDKKFFVSRFDEILEEVNKLSRPQPGCDDDVRNKYYEIENKKAEELKEIAKKLSKLDVDQDLFLDLLQKIKESQLGGMKKSQIYEDILQNRLMEITEKDEKSREQLIKKLIEIIIEENPSTFLYEISSALRKIYYEDQKRQDFNKDKGNRVLNFFTDVLLSEKEDRRVFRLAESMNQIAGKDVILYLRNILLLKNKI